MMSNSCADCSRTNSPQGSDGSMRLRYPFCLAIVSSWRLKTALFACICACDYVLQAKLLRYTQYLVGRNIVITVRWWCKFGFQRMEDDSIVAEKSCWSEVRTFMWVDIMMWSGLNALKRGKQAHVAVKQGQTLVWLRSSSSRKRENSAASVSNCISKRITTVFIEEKCLPEFIGTTTDPWKPLPTPNRISSWCMRNEWHGIIGQSKIKSELYHKTTITLNQKRLRFPKIDQKLD